MTQDFLIGTSTAMLLGIMAIIFLYFYYYKIEQKNYLLFWMIGCFFYCVRISILLVYVLFKSNHFILLLSESSATLSAFFIFIGASYYLRGKIRPILLIIPIISIGWYIVSIIYNWEFLIRHLLPSLVIGIMFLTAGKMFWKKDRGYLISRVVSIFFIIMGVHKLDYPILGQIEWFVPIGYLMNEVLIIAIAIGFAMIVYSNLRKQLLETESRYQALSNTTQDIIYSIDINGKLLTVNSQFHKLVKESNSSILNRHISDFFPNTTFVWADVIKRIISNREVYQLEYKALINGERRYYQVTLSPIFDRKSEIIAINGTHHDLTRYKEKEEIIRNMAYNDILTDLPNSHALYRHLTERISNQPEDTFAVIYIGLDQFKKINDLSGPSVGDELLKMVGKSIELQVKGRGILYRYGGDEFVIVTQNLNKMDIHELLKVVRGLFETRWIVKHQKLHLSASVGVCSYPEDADTMEDLLKNANMTLHYAKELGKNKTLFYRAELRKRHEKNDLLEKALINAIEANEFTLFFQPQVHVKNNTLRGFEALIRWKNPAVGIVSPNEFIPLAEKSGLIVPIGDWVINEACKIINYFHQSCNKKYSISVNISPLQIQQDDFVEKLEKVIKHWQIPAQYLELEITEGVLIDSFETTIQKLNQLYKLGVRLSLDDFGTGYSSFSYLSQLPIHLLKIDKSFTDDIQIDKQRAILLEKLIDLVKQMKLDVLVEGVEKKEQLVALKQWQCDYIQGYYLSKPLPLDQTLTYIKKDA